MLRQPTLKRKPTKKYPKTYCGGEERQKRKNEQIGNKHTCFRKQQSPKLNLLGSRDVGVAVGMCAVRGGSLAGTPLKKIYAHSFVARSEDARRWCEFMHCDPSQVLQHCSGKQSVLQARLHLDPEG